MTEQAKGTYSALKFAYEPTYNTDPTDLATNAFLMPFNTNGLKKSQNITARTTIRANRNPVSPIKGNIDVSGDFVVPVGATAFGHILKMFFGTPTTTAVTGKDGFYQHVFKLQEKQPSIVMETGLTDASMYTKFNGIKASKLALTVGGDGELTSTISLMGTKGDESATSMCTSPTELIIDDFDNFMASLKVGGETVADVTELALNFDMNLDGDTTVIGSKGYRTAVNEGIVSLNGQLTSMVKDSKYINLAENDTVTSIDLLFTKGDYSLEILLPELLFALNTPAVDGPKGIKLQMDFSAFLQNAAEKSSVVATLINKTASY